MDERRMTNEQRERERRRKAAAARKAAARYEDPGVGYQRRRRARKRRRRVRNVCIALLVIFIVVIGLAGGTIYWIKYGPTKETYDLNKYFGITAKSDHKATLVIYYFSCAFSDDKKMITVHTSVQLLGSVDK